MIWTALLLMVLAFIQNISFTVVSRSRNRNNFAYHLVAAIFSNGVWFLTFKSLITNNMNLALFVPYTIGTVSGSLVGQKVSMVIEKLIGAKSDG